MKLTTGLLYGKYSHPYGPVFNQRNINIRKTTIQKLPFYKKEKLKVLELGGTGQDAIAFAQLGFDTTFIDLSKINIQKTKNFAEINKLKLNVINGDFLKNNFNEKYDIIRSRGVIHHINRPEKVFLKINKLLKEGGYLHFNLYRSGTFYYWFVENLRNFSKKIDFKNFYGILSSIKLKKKENNFIGNKTIKALSDFKSIIIDDLYVPTLIPANYFKVKKFLINNNFDIIKENILRKEIDHNIRYPDFPLKNEHIVFDCKKNTKKKVFNLRFSLDNKSEISLTKKDQLINKNNNSFRKLIKLMNKKKLFNNKYFIKEIINLYKNCYLLSVKRGSKLSRHKYLNKRLSNFYNNFK